MRKTELINEVKQHLGPDCSLAHAERAVNAVLQSVTDGLTRDGTVQLMGFGTFQVKRQAARKNYNPQTGQMMAMEAKNRVAFKAGTGLRDAVQDGAPAGTGAGRSAGGGEAEAGA